MLKRIARSYRFRSAQLRVQSQLGVETVAEVKREDLVAVGPNLASAREYSPSPPLHFEEALKTLPIETGEYTFVDLGCGKALPMMLAARSGFKKVLGVEFAENVHQVAVSNLEEFRKRFKPSIPLEAYLGDASEFHFPPDPLVVYLYNPFGPDVLTKVLTNLSDSLQTQPRPCWLIYMVPLQAHVFGQFPSFRLYRDSIANQQDVRCLIYQFES